MSQESSGNNESHKTYTEEQLKNLQNHLDKYESTLGTNKVLYNEDVEQYLNLSAIQLRAMSIDECSIGAYELSRYSFIIQKEQNRINAELAWAKHNLNIVVGKNVGNYDKFKKVEERTMLVIDENSYAQALNKIILECRVRSESLNFLSGKITTISNRLSELAYSKRKIINEQS